MALMTNRYVSQLVRRDFLSGSMDDRHHPAHSLCLPFLYNEHRRESTALYPNATLFSILTSPT